MFVHQKTNPVIQTSKHLIMCTKIDCEAVILTYFENSSKKELTFKDLNNIRKKIESNNESFFVDVSYSAIRKTAIKFHNFIEIKSNGINLKNKKIPNNNILPKDCIRIIKNITSVKL